MFVVLLAQITASLQHGVFVMCFDSSLRVELLFFKPISCCVLSFFVLVKVIIIRLYADYLNLKKGNFMHIYYRKNAIPSSC